MKELIQEKKNRIQKIREKTREIVRQKQKINKKEMYTDIINN